ncbi:glycosyltransferase [Methylorubrum extorquens]
MSEYFDYSVCFVPPVLTRSTLLKVLLGYPWQAVQMAWIVLRRRPEAIWIQMPPNFLVHLCLILRLTYGRSRPRLVADLHNSALMTSWLSVPLTRRLLRRFDCVLVHNEDMRTAAVNFGVDARNLHVLEDRSPSFGETVAGPPDGKPCFVVPCSFYKDEPVRNVVEAARLMPDYEFMITGPRARAAGQGLLHDLPGNVTFTDYLPVADYDTLIARATAVLCLTTQDGVQLSAAGEAVGAGKPIIVSDTQLLQSLFEAGRFVDNSVEALHDACKDVANDYACYAARTIRLRDGAERNNRWLAQAAPIRVLLSTKPQRPHA